VDKGSYALLYRLKNTRKIDVGSLGRISFPAGYYVYLGSAFGPGGLKRVKRHRRLSQEGEGSTHWHIDYISEDCSSELLRAYLIPGKDVECFMASELSGDMATELKGFGCSDCGCNSHLISYRTEEAASEEIEKLLDSLETGYRIKNFITRSNDN